MPPVLDLGRMISWVAAGMLGHVVTPRELLGAQRAGEALLSCVHSVVVVQLLEW